MSYVPLPTYRDNSDLRIQQIPYRNVSVPANYVYQQQRPLQSNFPSYYPQITQYSFPIQQSRQIHQDSIPTPRSHDQQSSWPLSLDPNSQVMYIYDCAYCSTELQGDPAVPGFGPPSAAFIQESHYEVPAFAGTCFHEYVNAKTTAKDRGEAALDPLSLKQVVRNLVCRCCPGIKRLDNFNQAKTHLQIAHNLYYQPPEMSSSISFSRNPARPSDYPARSHQNQFQVSLQRGYGPRAPDITSSISNNPSQQQRSRNGGNQNLEAKQQQRRASRDRTQQPPSSLINGAVGLLPVARGFEQPSFSRDVGRQYQPPVNSQQYPLMTGPSLDSGFQELMYRHATVAPSCQPGSNQYPVLGSQIEKTANMLASGQSGDRPEAAIVSPNEEMSRAAKYVAISSVFTPTGHQAASAFEFVANLQAEHDGIPEMPNNISRSDESQRDPDVSSDITESFPLFTSALTGIQDILAAKSANSLSPDDIPSSNSVQLDTSQPKKQSAKETIIQSSENVIQNGQAHTTDNSGPESPNSIAVLVKVPNNVYIKEEKLYPSSETECEQSACLSIMPQSLSDNEDEPECKVTERQLRNFPDFPESDGCLEIKCQQKRMSEWNAAETVLKKRKVDKTPWSEGCSHKERPNVCVCGEMIRSRALFAAHRSRHQFDAVSLTAEELELMCPRLHCGYLAVDDKDYMYHCARHILLRHFYRAKSKGLTKFS